MPTEDLPLDPAKMTSSIPLPRSCLGLCSPMTHLMASTILLLPQPLGPTTPLIPLGKGIIVFSGNDLNPFSSNRLIFMELIVIGGPAEK